MGHSPAYYVDAITRTGDQVGCGVWGNLGYCMSNYLDIRRYEDSFPFPPNVVRFKWSLYNDAENIIASGTIHTEREMRFLKRQFLKR